MVWRICFVTFEGLGRKMVFCVCVLVDVHEMAKIRKFLCKQYVSAENNFEVPRHLMARLRSLVFALIIPVRIMSICCCPEQIFAIN